MAFADVQVPTSDCVATFDPDAVGADATAAADVGARMLRSCEALHAVARAVAAIKPISVAVLSMVAFL
jgi:hypothetical protein